MNSQELQVFKKLVSSLHPRLAVSKQILVEDSENWKQLYPLGPVRFQFRCKICGQILLSDSLECNIRKLSSKLEPHFKNHEFM